MRRFYSYGPVDCEEHFCVPRHALVQECLEQMIGNPDKGGHYFTIWAPRQTGKTWLMHQVKSRIETEYEDKFIVGQISMQGQFFSDKPHPDEFLSKAPRLLEDGLDLRVSKPETWEGFADLFHKTRGQLSKPVILFIDEFDSLPVEVIDTLVSMFRDIYISRANYCLHGLALIGVRAVLGVGSERGSPFNVQRSLQVPNLTKDEVEDLFSQYQEESGQKVSPEVVNRVFETTRGQPGLVNWFGELLTEKHNPGTEQEIDFQVWQRVYQAALHIEWNNTVLNLIKKAKGTYLSEVLDLFSNPEKPFSLDKDWCNYLYLNGIIDVQRSTDALGREVYVCRFSCPFIQYRLYNALTDDLVGERLSLLALHPLDELSDVFTEQGLNLPALLRRYQDYLKRLEEKGLSPWQGQPRRSDLQLTEAVGHFHLYAWLRQAVGKLCLVSPEFPTGNGKVDLFLRSKESQGIIEVKSYVDKMTLNQSKEQAAGYAHSLGLSEVTLAVFVPTRDKDILEELTCREEHNGVLVQIVAIGWG